MSEDAPIATAEIRYKTPDGEGESRSVSASVYANSGAGEDQTFAACVAEFGLILRASEHRGTASLLSVLDRLEALRDYLSRDAYKEEFADLVRMAIASEAYGG